MQVDNNEHACTQAAAAMPPTAPYPIAVICRRQVRIQKDSSSLWPPTTSALTENAAKFGQIRLGVRPSEMVIIMIRGDKER